MENDGFGLGAQRRAIEKNDLPQVQAELDAYLQALRSQQATADFQPTCGLIVPKEKIAANGDYNLSGERYRESGAVSRRIPLVTIERCLLKSRKAGSPIPAGHITYLSNYIRMVGHQSRPMASFSLGEEMQH